MHTAAIACAIPFFRCVICVRNDERYHKWQSVRPFFRPMLILSLQSQCEMDSYIFHRIGSVWLSSAAPANASPTNGSSKYLINDLTESMAIIIIANRSGNEQN